MALIGGTPACLAVTVRGSPASSFAGYGGKTLSSGPPLNRMFPMVNGPNCAPEDNGTLKVDELRPWRRITMYKDKATNGRVKRRMANAMLCP